MPAFLTPELAEAVIGLCVVAKEEGGGAGSSGWVNPSRVLRVHSYGKLVIQPNNHKKEEVADIRRLRLWMKGNHQLGEHAMKRAEAIDLIAEVQAKINRVEVRDMTIEEAKDLLGNGVNPLVMALVDKKRGASILARLVGVRVDKFLLKPVSDVDIRVAEFPVGDVGIPIGIDLDALDYNLLVKAMGAKNAPVPEKPAPVVPPKPTTPAIGTIPFPIRAPAMQDTPRAPKPEGVGQWVIVDRKSRSFWQRPGNGPGDWVKDIDKADVYDTSKGVNGAASRMKQEGMDPEPMSLEQARFFSDMWYKPSRLAEVAAEAEAAAAAKPPEPVPAQTMSHDGDHAYGEGRIGPDASKDRLADAIRNRAAAEVMLLEAKSKEAIARAEYEIDRL